ncbi:MAG: hypothetical protein GX311_01360 [Bacteroidales bacterium]|nr:hypothetical protein [Bacteroidales bacterium]
MSINSITGFSQNSIKLTASEKEGILMMREEEKLAYDVYSFFAETIFDLVISLYPFDYYSNLMAGWTKYFLDKKSEAKILFNTVLIISPIDSSAKEGLNLIK